MPNLEMPLAFEEGGEHALGAVRGQVHTGHRDHAAAPRRYLPAAACQFTRTLMEERSGVIRDRFLTFYTAS